VIKPSSRPLRLRLRLNKLRLRVGISLRRINPVCIVI
jgi:hypothetical protein